MSKLNILIGLSGSGKSEYAKNLADKDENYVIVGSDKIRKEIFGDESDQSDNKKVFDIFHKRIKEYLNSGVNVIADATNVTLKSRYPYYSYSKGHDVYYTILNTAFQDCVDRDNERNRVVTEEVIRRQLAGFHFPMKYIDYNSDTEPIKDDNIIIVNNSNSNKVGVSDYIERMKGFDQKNPHHKRDLYEHSLAIAKNLSRKDSNMYYPAILHDVGKLFTQTFDEDGIAHYYRHESFSAYIFMNCLDELSEYIKDKGVLNDCIRIVNNHMLPFFIRKSSTKDKYIRLLGSELLEKIEKFNFLDRFYN